MSLLDVTLPISYIDPSFLHFLNSFFFYNFSILSFMYVCALVCMKITLAAEGGIQRDRIDPKSYTQHACVYTELGSCYPFGFLLQLLLTLQTWSCSQQKKIQSVWFQFVTKNRITWLQISKLEEWWRDECDFL